MDFLSNNLVEWFVLALIILALIYAAVVIKNEKYAYEESAVEIDFYGLKCLVPSWWGKVEESENYIRFERTDTYYEWSAEFLHLSEDSRESKQIVLDKLTEMKVVIDEHEKIDVLPESFFSDQEFSKNFDSYRLEGTGTLDQIKRVYIDIFACNNKKQAYLFISKSSVLNGLVEGPYFEEVLRRLKV